MVLSLWTLLLAVAIGISQIVESDNYVILASEDEVTTPKYDPSEDFKNPLMDIIREKPIDENGPYFDMKENESNITGVVGDTIYLRCRVRNLGNRTVSWIRHRDIHLLAVGRYTYTSDQRFEAIHPPHTEEWAMKIKYPQRKDSGVYECQVSTIPPISFRINLNVKEAFTQIVGGPDLFIDNGSTINLTCLIDYTPQPPPDIIWKHGDQEINFDSPRGGISLVTVKGIPNTTSRLLIQKANTNDSGEYTCAPSNANPSSIRVHILNEIAREPISETYLEMYAEVLPETHSGTFLETFSELTREIVSETYSELYAEMFPE